MPAFQSQIRPALAATLLIFSLPAAAQWTGKGEAGLAFADGNTDSRTANARIESTYKADVWEHRFNIGGLYVRSEGDTTARRWDIGGQSRFDFQPNTFWYGGARYEEDRFSGFDYQALLTTGIGRRFIDNDRTRLSAQVGVGYKQLETLTTPRETDKSITGVASMDFTHQITDTTSIFDRFGGEFGEDNNFMRNEAGVVVKMTDRLALSLAYTVRHNTEPPAGFKKTDTLTTANLVYEVR